MIRSKEKYGKSDQSRDRKGLCSKPMGDEKKKSFQNEVKQWNMVQKWEKEVFNLSNNLKHNIDYKKFQENN